MNITNNIDCFSQIFKISSLRNVLNCEQTCKKFQKIVKNFLKHKETEQIFQYEKGKPGFSIKSTSDELIVQMQSNLFLKRSVLKNLSKK